MNKLLAFLLLCFSTTSFSQSTVYKWIIQVTLQYEQTNNHFTQAYFDTGKEINLTTDQYQREVGHTQTETKPIKGTNPQLAYQFIEDGLNDSVYYLPLDLVDLDSSDLEYLVESGYIKDSLIIIHFPHFERQASKRLKACDECYPMLTHKRDDSNRDVDELLLRFVVNNEDVIRVFVGKDKYVWMYDFQKWLLFEEANRKFDLFSHPEVQYYFSRKRLSEEMKDYVMVLQR